MIIHNAIEAGDLLAVAQILDQDPGQLEIANAVGDQPLHEAARRVQQPIVRLLLEKGADINAPGHRGHTPLHYAALEDAPELARLLLEYGADVDIKDREGFTPHQIAARIAPQVAEVLNQHGGKVDLNSAIRLRDLSTVRRLLRAKKGLRAVSAFPEQLLEDGMFARNSEIFNLLLNYDRHPNPLELARPDSLLFRAIEQAMSECNTTFTRKLLEHGASASSINQRGESPLAYLKRFNTARGGNPNQAEVKKELVRLLKRHGAR